MRRAAWLALAFAAAGCTLVGVPAGRAGRPPRPAALPRAEHPAAGRPTVEPVRRFREVRGLWVVRSSMESPEQVRSMVARASAAGFNTLLVQVRGRGDAYYDSRWEPRAEALRHRPDFDPLALVIKEAHRRGMAVDAWVETHLVWGMGALPKSPEHIVNAHPDWLAVPRSLGRRLYDMDPSDPRYVQALIRYARDHRRTVAGLFTSPSSPQVQEHLYDVWMDLVEHYDLDGIHFDSIRYPSSAFDYSRGALLRFRRWVRPRLAPARFAQLDSTFRHDPYAFVDALPGPWGEFRRKQITDLVRRSYWGIKARKPRIVVSAAVFADERDAYENRFQDWPAWLREGILDVVVPMAYTTNDSTFRREIEGAIRAAGGPSRVWAGIGAYLNGYRGTMAQIDIARRLGVAGIVLFSYDWAVTDGSPAGRTPFLERIGRSAFGAK